jgi:hypothetical protein
VFATVDLPERMMNVCIFQLVELFLKIQWSKIKILSILLLKQTHLKILHTRTEIVKPIVRFLLDSAGTVAVANCKAFHN